MAAGWGWGVGSGGGRWGGKFFLDVGNWWVSNVLHENQEEPKKKMDLVGNVTRSHLNTNSACQHTIHFSLARVASHICADSRHRNGMNKYGVPENEQTTPV